MKASPITNCECVFCGVDKERVICENGAFFAMYDGFPVNPGHTLIIPKEHKDNVLMLNSKSMEDLHDIIHRVIHNILNDKFHPDGYNIGTNIGETAGQTVPHAHIHIIPRYKGDVENPRGGVRGVIPNKKEY